MLREVCCELGEKVPKKGVQWVKGCLLDMEEAEAKRMHDGNCS